MAQSEPASSFDLVIVGSGAAGLAVAAFAAHRLPGRSIAAVDSMRQPGAKILVTGGGRCNVTNCQVTAGDFNGGSQNSIRRILAAFTVSQTVSWFRKLGLEVHEEAGGKLFPDSGRSKSVLDALLRVANGAAVEFITGSPVLMLEKSGTGFVVHTRTRQLAAQCVVLATGGRSLPKTGSDGSGYALATALGHSLVPTTPALVPLVLGGSFHSGLSGIAHEVEILISCQGGRTRRVRGELLWTHFGVSGPAALDASRHWLRAQLEQRSVSVAASFLPGENFESAEAKLLALSAQQPRRALHNALGAWLPARLVDAALADLEIGRGVALAQLPREQRRRLLNRLLNWPLPVFDSRGYEVAEITAGGVPLNEINPSTMESRKCPRLFLAGEILDVDGRLGGFNLQWAWSSAWVAAAGACCVLGV